MGLVFRDDGLVVKQTFIMQATQTHMRSHHDPGSPEVRAQNRGLTQGHTEREAGAKMQRAGSPSSRGDAGSRQAGSKGQGGGRGPEEAALDGRSSPQGGKAMWGAKGETPAKLQDDANGTERAATAVTSSALGKGDSGCRGEPNRGGQRGREASVTCLKTLGPVKMKAPCWRRSQPRLSRPRMFSKPHWLVL